MTAHSPVPMLVLNSMRQIDRYVAYYRMPTVGDTPNGDMLAGQRGDIEAFLDRPDRTLVGEFTEVMTPAHEGETSPAFDLSLECCQNLDARLVCAASHVDLPAAALDKAARAHVEVLMVEGAGPRSGPGPGLRADDENVPFLRLGRRLHAASAGPPPRKHTGETAGNRAKADRFAAAMLPVINRIRADGATTLTDIAAALNARNIRTARGRRWYPTTVKNILDRSGE